MKKGIFILSCAVAFLLAGTIVSNAQVPFLECPGSFVVLNERCIHIGAPGDSTMEPGEYQIVCRQIHKGQFAMPAKCEGDACPILCPDWAPDLWICCGKISDVP